MKAELINVGLTSDHIRIKEVNTKFLKSPFHFHDSCELVMIQESSGKRIVGDHIGNFTEGDLVIMGPNLPHIWQNDTQYSLKHDTSVRAIVIYFSPVFLIELAKPVMDESIIIRFIENISRGMVFKNPVNKTAIDKLNLLSQSTGLKKMSLFIEIIDLFVKSKEFEFLASELYKNSYNAKDTKRFNDVYQFLINNFQREISLEEISEISKMSPNAFCRYFKSKTKKSFTNFLNELRIGHSCKLLKNPDTPISNIYYESGFNNPVNFNKIFKKVIGTTPTEYRKH